jgi:hypothetical protein
MKSGFFALCIVLATSICALGYVSPDASDFSGNWIQDTDKSETMATYVDGKIQPVTVDLIVRQDTNSLNVESVWSNKPATQMIYLLDGNEHSFKDEAGNLLGYRVMSNNDQLVIEGSKKVNTPFGTAEIKTQEEWSLSADQKALTILTTTTNASFGKQTRRQIYTK